MPGDGHRVRRARHEDAAVIAELLSELGYPVSEAELAERLAALSVDDVVLVADDGAGMLAQHRIARLAEGDPLTRITALVVRRSSRGSGVARALLQAAEDAARDWGCTLIEVSSGRRPERVAAHGFYLAAGFADMAPRSTRYWKPLR
ncbi:MAG: N-acetyltransferase family protein [Solirubrobacteraceae bacterium]